MLCVKKCRIIFWKWYNQSLMNSHRESLKKVNNDTQGLTQALARATSNKARDFLLEQINSLNDKSSEIKQEVERLKNERTSFKETVISAENIFSALQIVNKKLSKITQCQRKELLSNIIKKVTVYKDKIAVQYFGYTDLPLSNNEHQAHNDMVIGSYNVRIGEPEKT